MLIKWSFKPRYLGQSPKRSRRPNFCHAQRGLRLHRPSSDVFKETFAWSFRKEGLHSGSSHLCAQASCVLITYHICSLIFFPSSSIVLILKSIPKKIKNKKEGNHIRALFCLAATLSCIREFRTSKALSEQTRPNLHHPQLSEFCLNCSKTRVSV